MGKGQGKPEGAVLSLPSAFPSAAAAGERGKDRFAQNRFVHDAFPA